MKYENVKIYHYGGLFPSKPQRNYSQNRKQLKCFDDVSLELGFKHVKSVPSQYTQPNRYRLPPFRFPSLQDYDIVIIDDSPKSCLDFDVLRNYLENEVKEKGRTLMLLGGYGLGKFYNVELEPYLGGKIGERFPDYLKSKGYSKDRISRIRESIRISDGPGKDLRFRGFVIFKAYNEKDILWNFEVENVSVHQEEPAIVIHKINNGNLVIFTSGCHPDWGKYAMTQEKFREMWGELFDFLLESFFV